MEESLRNEDIRKLFDIKEGDSLMVMGDITKGIALLKTDEFYKLLGGIVPDDSNQDE